MDSGRSGAGPEKKVMVRNMVESSWLVEGVPACTMDRGCELVHVEPGSCANNRLPASRGYWHVLLDRCCPQDQTRGDFEGCYAGKCRRWYCEKSRQYPCCVPECGRRGHCPPRLWRLLRCSRDRGQQPEQPSLDDDGFPVGSGRAMCCVEDRVAVCQATDCYRRVQRTGQHHSKSGLGGQKMSTSRCRAIAEAGLRDCCQTRGHWSQLAKSREWAHLDHEHLATKRERIERKESMYLLDESQRDHGLGGGKRPRDPIGQALRQADAHHDGRGHSKRVRQDLEDEPNKPAQATSATTKYFPVLFF
jgi:hypothetical protein